MADIATQLAQAQARVKDLQARSRKQLQRDETRRKIIFGAAVLALAKRLSDEPRVRFLQQLTAQITRDADRQFLGLSPLASPVQKEGSKADKPAAPKQANG